MSKSKRKPLGKPEAFVVGDFGEGTASYAKLNGVWWSVNGTADRVIETRWTVRNEAIIDRLNRQAQGGQSRSKLNERLLPILQKEMKQWGPAFINEGNMDYCLEQMAILYQICDLGWEVHQSQTRNWEAFKPSYDAPKKVEISAVDARDLLALAKEHGNDEPKVHPRACCGQAEVSPAAVAYHYAFDCPVHGPIRIGTSD